MAKIVRGGVTLPPDLLKETNETIDNIGIDSRSKAIQDSVRSFVAEHKWLRAQKGNKSWHVGDGLRSRGQGTRNRFN